MINLFLATIHKKDLLKRFLYKKFIMELKLKRLRRDIIEKYFIDEWKEVWFFPEYENVKGFSGIQDIIFLGLNPSYGHFPSQYDKFFYRELRKNAFENAHITDLIKIKAPNKKINELIENGRILKEQMEFLMREIKIIHPKIIVTLGKKCDNIFRENFKNSKIKIIKIRHYSSIRFPRNKELFSKELKEVRNSYLETRGDECT